MDIEKKIQITLSAEDVSKLVADYLTNQGYKVSSKNLEMRIGIKTTGYGLGTFNEHYFKECIATIKE